MEDHRLRAFCLLAELKSFSKAAEAKFITQSAMSHIIKNMEEELGVKLVHRGPKNLSLTDAGRVVYQYARRILDLYREMEDEISRVTGQVRGTLNIGATSTAALYLLPQALYDFKKKHAHLQIELCVDTTEKLISALESRDVDIAIVEGKLKTETLTAEPIAEDEIVIIAADDNPLVSKESVTPDELLQQPFIMPARGTGLREFIEDFFREFKLNPEKLRISFVVEPPELILQMVQAGFGIAFISKWVAFKALREGTVKLLPINRGRLTRGFYLLLPEQEPSAMNVRCFREFIREYRFFSPVV